jgi:sec-independent protein translocase protein TatC
MTLGEHLDELRKRIVRALLGVAICAAVSAVFYQDIMTALLVPYLHAWNRAQELYGPKEAPQPVPSPTPEGTTTLSAPLSTLNAPIPPRIMMGSPITGIMAIIIVTTVVGLFVASPWVLYQLWAFIAVGLHEHERKFVRTYGPISFFLFVGGSAVFYFLLLPLILAALMSPALMIKVEGAQLIDPSVLLSDYLKFIALMTIIFGAMFETPLIVIFLARTGIVPLETMARKQKLIIFILIVAGAIIAPAGDPVSCGVMAGMLILLFEIGLLAAWILTRRQRKREALEAAQNKDEPPLG